VNYQLATTAAQKGAILKSAVANAAANAKIYAGYNGAGGVDSLTLNDADIEFGFTDGSANYAAGTNSFPNTIKVTMRRDGQANGNLSLFFAPLLGFGTTGLTAAAAATMFGGPVDSFSSSPSSNIPVLPAAYDVNAWNTFVASGLDPDGNLSTYNSNPALQVYPSIKAPGNFGQVSLNGRHSGSRHESAWVAHGISSADVTGLTGAHLIPLSSQDSSQWNWIGDAGIKSSLIYSIDNYVGRQFMLPLFNPYNSGVPQADDYAAGLYQGSYYRYQIVQFVGITVVPGGNQNVTVQPCALINPNVTFLGNGPVPVGTGSASGLVTIFSAPKLTQ
jgi:Putative Tad-like Flp pilus-assembly